MSTIQQQIFFFFLIAGAYRPNPARGGASSRPFSRGGYSGFGRGADVFTRQGRAFPGQRGFSRGRDGLPRDTIDNSE